MEMQQILEHHSTFSLQKPIIIPHSPLIVLVLFNWAEKNKNKNISTTFNQSSIHFPSKCFYIYNFPCKCRLRSRLKHPKYGPFSRLKKISYAKNKIPLGASGHLPINGEFEERQWNWKVCAGPTDTVFYCWRMKGWKMSLKCITFKSSNESTTDNPRQLCSPPSSLSISINLRVLPHSVKRSKC